MIKRLASASVKKTKNARVLLRSKSKQTQRAVTQNPSTRAAKEQEATLAAERIFPRYEAAEAGCGKARSKPVEYPLDTKGTRLAAKARAKANGLTETKRAALFNKGMAMIYGSASKKAARARH